MASRRFQTAILAAACALGAAAGCATSSKQQTGDKKYVTVCTEDAPTGSHISRLKCYRKVDQDERTRQDRSNLEKMRSGTTRSVNPSLDPAAGNKLLMQASRSSMGASHSQNKRSR